MGGKTISDSRALEAEADVAGARAARGAMEKSFGADFSSVKTHGQGLADHGAGLASHGTDIHLHGKGLESHGQGLMAHEATHVVQQRAGSAAPVQR